MNTVETAKNTLINKSRLANFVREKRRILGMTQRQLANYLKQQYNAEFTYGTVCNLENPHNESTPNAKTLMTLAKLAGTDNIDIFLAFINNPSAIWIKDN